MQTSKAGWGMVGFVVFNLLSFSGFDLSVLPTDMSLWTLGEALSAGLWAYGQVMRSDLFMGLIRK